MIMKLICEVCGHKGTPQQVSFHHFYPRPYRSLEPKDHQNDGIYICTGPHMRLHSMYSNLTLYEDYSSKETLVPVLMQLE